jgi:hypothetical protein
MGLRCCCENRMLYSTDSTSHSLIHSYNWRAEKFQWLHAFRWFREGTVVSLCCSTRKWRGESGEQRKTTEWNFRNYGIFRITVAARSKAWIFFARTNSGIVFSNPTHGMNVCVRLFRAYVVLCVGSGLATAWFPVQGVLATVCRLKKLKKQPRSN